MEDGRREQKQIKISRRTSASLDFWVIWILLLRLISVLIGERKIEAGCPPGRGLFLLTFHALFSRASLSDVIRMSCLLASVLYQDTVSIRALSRKRQWAVGFQ